MASEAGFSPEEEATLAMWRRKSAQQRLKNGVKPGGVPSAAPAQGPSGPAARPGYIADGSPAGVSYVQDASPAGVSYIPDKSPAGYSAKPGGVPPARPVEATPERPTSTGSITSAGKTRQAVPSAQPAQRNRSTLTAGVRSLKSYAGTQETPAIANPTWGRSAQPKRWAKRLGG